MSIEDSIKQIREALAAGPTPGPWTLTDERGRRWLQTTAREQVVARVYKDGSQAEFQATSDMLAACSPEVLAHLLAALDEREALREDAERYRKWRAVFTSTKNEPLNYALADAWELDEVDAAIDAARKEPT